MFRDQDQSELRNRDLDLTIDPGFVNHRLVETIIGEQGIALINNALHSQPQLPEGLQATRIAHYYTKVLLAFCKHIQVKTLGQLLASGSGTIFCSTESLLPTPNIYEQTYAISQIQPKGDCEFEIFLEYTTSHIHSDTCRMQLHRGGDCSVIAVFKEKIGNKLFFRPLVIGFPWLYSEVDSNAENWAMWYGLEFFENFIDDFDEFSKVKDIQTPKDFAVMNKISENSFKKCLVTILGETASKDWGGEKSDHFSAHLHLNGKRVSGAFLLKGPAHFAPMGLNHLGKNNNQICRLAEEPANVLFVQHCHEITPDVRNTLRAFAVQPGRARRYCLIDGKDSLRLLTAYNLLDAAVGN